MKNLKIAAFGILCAASVIAFKPQATQAAETEEQQIIRIADGQTASQVKRQLRNNDIEIVNADGESLGKSSIVATGDRVIIYNNGDAVSDSEVVVPGDVDGDGDIDVLDIEAVQKDILGIDKPLQGVYRQAGLLSDTGTLSVLDMESVQKDILGLEYINPKAHDISGTYKELTDISEKYDSDNLLMGIDVSKWQGEIDWKSVAADGISFAMIKCGGGDDGLYEDRYFRYNIENAIANGLRVGVYFYSGATDVAAAKEEAEYCLSLIKDYDIKYPVAFDWELNDDEDPDVITEVCEAFCDIIADNGYAPMIYTNRNRWYNNFDGEKIASKYKVWMAAYFGKFYYDSVRWTYGDDLPNFRYHYDMWQYSSRCYVDGISGQVDVDIAFFGYANYHVDTKDAVLTVTNKEIKRTYGDGIGRLTEELNLLDGVKGINTIGYDMDIEYSIYDESGNEYSEEEAISTAGKYTVEYRFKDPKSGWIKNTAKLEIEVITEEFTGNDIVVKNNTMSKDYNFRTGVSCKNNLGQEAELTGVVIKRVNIETEEEDVLTEQQAIEEKYDFDKYTYVAEYAFNVPGEGEVIKKAAIVRGAEE